MTISLSRFLATAALAALVALPIGASAGISEESPATGDLPRILGPAPVRVAQVSAPELIVRIDHLEEQIRQLTGTVEQLQYRNQQLEQQLRRYQEGAENRPPDSPGTHPARGQLAPPAAPVMADQGLPSGPPGLQRRPDVFDPTQNPNAPGAPQTLGALPAVGAPGALPRSPMAGEPAMGPGVGAPGGRAAGAPLDLSTLSAAVANEPTAAPGGGPAPGGSLPPPPPRNPNATGAQQTVLAPSATPRDDYDLAYGYMLRKDYALAEEGFRVFLKRYPNDRFVSEATYWLGESLFQRQRYRDAAESFLIVSTKFETSAKASDALLRLGESLAALGEKDAACATLGEVGRKYPRAAATVKQTVEREQKRVGC